MNYVKHLSIALLVLATTSVFAKDTDKKVIGYTTPEGKTVLVDNKGTWEFPAEATVAEKVEVKGNKTGRTPGDTHSAYTTPKKSTKVPATKPEAAVPAGKYFGHKIEKEEKDGKVTLYLLDDKDQRVKKDGKEVTMVPVYETEAGVLKSTKDWIVGCELYKNWKYQAGLAAGVGVAGYLAYQNSEAFKNFVDGKIEDAQELINDAKEGKNNARLKLGLGVGLPVATFVALKWTRVGEWASDFVEKH